MYTREITAVPDSFVKDRRPVFGTFKGHPAVLDIRGIYKPYGVLPLPVRVTNFCVRSRLLFSFFAGDYIGRIHFIDVKAFGFSEVTLWNIKTGAKAAYRSLTGFRRHFVPNNLEKAVTSNYIKRRYIRLGWDKSQKRLSVRCRLKGDSSRPSVRASFSAGFGDESERSKTCELTFSEPYPTLRRSHVSFESVSALEGGLALTHNDGSEESHEGLRGVCAFNITSAYMEFHSRGDAVLLIGSYEGSILAVALTSDIEGKVDTYTYNRNAVFYKGETLPLPPVVISHYSGIEKQWVIQDTENMVDLTFTPVSVSANRIQAFIIRSVYSTIYGTIDGSVVTGASAGAEGRLVFKAFPALAENYLVRL